MERPPATIAAVPVMPYALNALHALYAVFEVARRGCRRADMLNYAAVATRREPDI